MAEEVIGLLFGVDGGGEIDGKSGKQIVKDLTKIVNQINGSKSKVPKIKLKFDVSEAKKAVSDLKKQLKDIEKIAYIKEIHGKSKSGKSNANQNLQKQNEEYRALTASVKQYYAELAKMEKIQMKNSDVSKNKGGAWETKDPQSQYKDRIKHLNQLKDEYDKLDVKVLKNGEIEIKSAKTLGISEQQRLSLIKQIQTAMTTLTITNEKNAASTQDTWNKNAAKVHEYIQRTRDVASKNKEIKNMMDDLDRLAASGDPKNLDELTRKFGELQQKIRESGADVETWGDKFKKTFAGKVRSALAGAITAAFTKYLREIYQNVVNIDKALVNLQIASGKSREETQRLVKEYAQLGKQLGATTTEVAEAADTWLRQGYSAEEANTLIKNSMMLSKLGQMESTEASTALTSAMKGYGVAVEDSIKIVDKFTKVDMEAAASAGDIATAMAETATSADIAGVSMDKLIGYITTVKEVTQDGAESVGTFYKTLFARMNNVKAGKFVDDETGEELNDVEKTLGKLGISLRDTNGLFRNSGEVLDEVAARWKSFDNVSQHAIATAFAGTRQQEKFIVLMQNYGSALQYAETAANSSGTAMEKFGDYTEGIEGKMKALKATFEELSMTFLDGELVTGVIGILTHILGAFNSLIGSLGGLNAVLYITASIIATIKAESILTFFSKVLSFIPNLCTSILTFSQALAAAKASGMSMGEGIAAAFNSVKISASAAQIAVGSLTAIIGIAIAAFNAYNSQIQESVNQQLTSANRAHEEGNKYLETAKSLDELTNEYEKLSKANGGVFSGESAEKVRTIQDKITKLVGDQAKNIDLVNGKLDEEIQKMRELANGDGGAVDNAIKKGQTEVANAKNAYEEKVGALFAPEHYIEGTDTVTTLWGLYSHEGDQIDFTKEWAEKYGVELNKFDRYTGFGNSTDYYGLRNNFDSFEDFVAQYENISKLNADLAKEHGDSGLFKATSEYINEYKEIYDKYISGNLLIEEAQKTKAGIDEIFTEPKNTGLAVALKSTSDILEEVRGGYDGISEALSNVTSEGYLTADALSTLFKLEEENALAGLKLEDILRRDANGYKVAENALAKYVQALINKYAALESINTFQDRANALTNLQNLYTILSTLANTGSKGDNGSDKLKEQLEEQKEALNNQVDAYKELIDLRKDLLESYVDELKYEKELAKKQEDVSRLQTKLTVARLDNSASGQARVRELEEELKEAEEDLEEFTLEHAVDEITENLDEQYEEYKRFIDKRVGEITEEISKIGKSSSGSSGIDLSWLKSMLEEIEKAIKEIETKPLWNRTYSSEFGVKIEFPATNPTVPVPEILQGKGKWISMYHSGGIVGDTHIGKNEEFAKLLKGEFVSTPAQMKRFMEKTLPQVATYTSNEKSNEFNAPLISIECESINQDTLPGLKDVVDSAVEEIKKILDGGMSRVGHKRQARKLLI